MKTEDEIRNHSNGETPKAKMISVHPSPIWRLFKFISYSIILLPSSLWAFLEIHGRNYEIGTNDALDWLWPNIIHPLILKEEQLREFIVSSLANNNAKEKTSQFQNSHGVELGRKLLLIGDPSGAEAICTVAAQNNEKDVEAWTCLGESRLALYHSAWKSRLSVTDLVTVYRRLNGARKDFETAVSLDPTRAEARSGLGLCLFLLGTRVEEKDMYDTSLELSPTQLLFDAVLHFNAAIALVSSFMMEENADHAEMENILLASSYNSALAYLALGDSASALAPLQRANDIVKKHKSNGISLPEVNFGAALLQRGATSETVSITSSPAESCTVDLTEETESVSFYNENNNFGKKIRLQKACLLLSNNLAVAKEIEHRKQPSIGHDAQFFHNGQGYNVALQIENSLNWDESIFTSLNNDELTRIKEFYEDRTEKSQETVLEEEDEREGGKQLEEEEEEEEEGNDFTETVDKNEIDLGSLHEDSIALEEEDEREGGKQLEEEEEEGEEEGNDLTETVDKNEIDLGSLHEDSIADQDIVENINTESFETEIEDVEVLDSTINSESSPISDIDASISLGLRALEKAAAKNPSRARTWLSLSRVKLQMGDKTGAVEAGAKALNLAEGFDEIDASTSVLEEALQYIADGTKISSSTGKADDVNQHSENEMNPFEQELHLLKLQVSQLTSTSIGIGLPKLDRLQPITQPPTDIKGSSEILQPENIEDSNDQIIAEDDAENLPSEGTNEDSNNQLNIENGAENQQAQGIDEESTEKLIIEDGVGEKLDEDLSSDDDVTTEKENDSEQMKDTEDEVSTSTTSETTNNNSTDPSLNAEYGDGSSNDVKDVSTTNEDEVTSLAERGIEDDAPSNEVTEDPITVELETENTIQTNETNKDVSPKIISEIVVLEDTVPITANNSEEIDEAPKEENVAVVELESSEDNVEEEGSIRNEVEVPPLFQPSLVENEEEVPATALSYMQVADAYFEKDNFKLASKQFLKVIKKAPNYIPAHLGYASTLERSVKPKQFGDVVQAYAKITKIALERDEKRLAESTYRRALNLVNDMDTISGKIDTLKDLSVLSFTYDLAAEVYYTIGAELLNRNFTDAANSDQEEAINAFYISNAYAAKEENYGEEEENRTHSKSLFQLGKIALNQGDTKKANLYFEAINLKQMDAMIVEALVLSGRVKEMMGDHVSAIKNYRAAITEEQASKDTGAAHYHLGLALSRNGESGEESERHLIMGLNMGMEATPEVIEILGNDNIAVMKAVNREEWRRYKESLEEDNSGRGGIINGGGFSNESVFNNNNNNAGTSDDSNGDTLSILEQGAATYDGSVPTGEEVDDGSGEATTSTIVSNQQSSARAKV